MDQLLATWPSQVDNLERTRRLIDLFLVSVLLDAGAGTTWQYKSKESGKIYRRSEGLAVASIEMFKTGLFSSNPEQPHQVDGRALQRLSFESLARGLQSTETNQLAGMEGRAGVLARLGDALGNQTYFGPDARPGNMLGMTAPSSHKCWLNLTRLSSIPSINAGLVSSNNSCTITLGCLDGWVKPHLASYANCNRWSASW